MKTLKLSLTIFCASLLLISCQNSSNDNAHNSMEEHADELKVDVQQEKDALKVKLEDMKKDINNEISTIDSKLGEASAETKEKMNEQKLTLTKWNNEIDDKLDKLADNDTNLENFKEETKEFFDEKGKEFQVIKDDIKDWINGPKKS